MATFQEQLNDWKSTKKANDMIDEIISNLNAGIINPAVNMTVKIPVIALITEIESDRMAYKNNMVAKLTPLAGGE